MSKQPRLDSLKQYNKIRYTAKRRPITNYPKKLAHYLSQKYLLPYSRGVFLDIGCGRGDFTNEFQLLGFDVYGIDMSLNELFLNNQKFTTLDFDGNKLPYQDNFFDIVFTKSVIEHVKNIDLFISECHRVLKPNGICVTLTPDWKAQYKHFYDDYTHVSPFTKMGLEDAFLSHKFQIIDSKRFRQLPFLWEMPSLHFLCNILSFFPDVLKKYKLIKFSKEWMLLLITKKEVSL